MRLRKLPNKMKDTVCRKCGKNLNDVSYAQMMRHIEEHRLQDEKNKSQTTMKGFF